MVYCKSKDQILKEADQLSYEGNFQEAINLIQNTLSSKPLLEFQILQLKLKLQSLYYNSDQANKALLIVQDSLKNKLVQNDFYFYCRYLLAYGSIIYKTTHKDKLNTVNRILQIYYKALLYYNKGLKDKDYRFIQDLELKVKLHINILLMLRIRTQQLQAYGNSDEIDLNNLKQLKNKDVLPTDCIYVKYDDKIVNINITRYMHNLEQIKSDIYTLGNKQLIDYYNNLHLLILTTIITDHLNKGIIHVLLDDKIVDLNLIICLTVQKIKNINLKQFSYRNKESFILAIYNLFKSFQQIINNICMMMSVLQVQKQFVNQITTETKKVQLKDALQHTNPYHMKTLLAISNNTMQFKFNQLSKESQNKIKQWYLLSFSIVNYYYKILQMLYTKIKDQVQLIQESSIIKVYINYYYLVVKIYKKLYQFLNGQNLICCIEQQYRQIINKADKNKPHQYGVLLYIAKSLLQMMRNYYLYKKEINKCVICDLEIKQIESYFENQQSNSLLSQLTKSSDLLNSNINQIKQLQESNKLLQNFAHILAHDLKTPVRNIITFSRLLQIQNKDQLDQLGKQSVELILQYGNKMKDLIDSSLLYAQVNKKINKSQFNLHQLIIDVLKHNNFKFRGSNIFIKYKLQDIPKIIYGDRTLIGIVIMNIISNSIKACNGNQNSIIQIGSNKKNWLYISDNGKGMNEQQVQNIFNLFYRSDDTQKVQGLGLGMSIVKRILDSHNSTIIIDSKEGKGTIVYFTLSVV